MKLILFGGAEIENNGADKLKILIKNELLKINPSHLLHVPFARLTTNEESWKQGWLQKLLKDTQIKVLDANEQNDLNEFNSKIIFINGGHDKLNLIEKINSNDELKKLILNAEYIIAESSGAACLGKYFRVTDDGSSHENGLNLLKDTIIEGYFTARNRKPLLESQLKTLDVKYGFGIDSHTGMVVDSKTFPANYDVFGEGKIYLFTK